MNDPVTLYVRKGGSDDTRSMNFRIPAELTPSGVMEIFDQGYAIDGNKAAIEVSALPDILRAEQVKIIDLLRTLGYAVQFDRQ